MLFPVKSWRTIPGIKLKKKTLFQSPQNPPVLLHSLFLMKARSVAAPLWGNDGQPFLCIYREITSLLGNRGWGLPRSLIFQSTRYKILCQSTSSTHHWLVTPAQNDLVSCLQLLPISCTMPTMVVGDPATFPMQKAVTYRLFSQVRLMALHRELSPPKTCVPSSDLQLGHRLGSPAQAETKNHQSHQKEANSPLVLQKTQAASKKKAF